MFGKTIGAGNIEFENAFENIPVSTIIDKTKYIVQKITPFGFQIKGAGNDVIHWMAIGY